MKKSETVNGWSDHPLKKTFLIMRIIVFLLLATILQTYANDAYAQRTKLSLNFNNTALEQVLDAIENQSEFFFLYNEKLVDVHRKVTVKANDQAINEILNGLFEGTDVEYSIVDRKIVLAPENISEAVQQQRGVSGKVTDRAGLPLPGVTVVIKGTTQGTITDVSGNYNFNNLSENSTLIFSFVGMRTVEVPIGAQTVIDISLEDETVGIEEVVAIGYGTMQKKHLTGAVGSIKMDDDMAFRPNSEFGQTMYGRVAGVQVLNTSGRPGVSSTVQIRGINSISATATPLVVIDGVIMPDYDLSTINPSDIETIDILKDAASSSIYGSRGANGVILVTTKSGQTGKPKFTINHSSSLQQVIRRVDVMNSAEYAQATIDAAQNGWIDKGGDPNAPNTIEARGDYKYTWPLPMDNPSTLFDTDWHDIVFRVAPMHKTDLNLAGGDANTTYFLSGGVLTQEGVLINTDYQKYSLNLKIDSKITDWLKIGGGLNASFDYENRSGNTSVHTLTSANQYPPVYPVYGSDGYLGGPHNTPGFENHVNVLFRTHHGHPYHRGGGGEIMDIKRRHTLGNVYGEIAILKGLTFRSSFNAFLRNNEERYYMNADTGQGPTVLRQARNEVSTGSGLNYTALNQLMYKTSWDFHQLDAVVGYEFTQREFYGVSASRRNYDNDLVPYLSAGNTVYSASDNAYESALISAFGRVNYNYDGKYMAAVSFRTDGSSRFGPNYKWGNFPSISIGWRVSQEDFFAKYGFISNLNLRFSYGFTGNESIGDYRWVSSMAQARVAFGNTLAMSYYPSSVENPELRWEKTRQQNFGFDLGFIKDRITIETDLFKSNSEDLLLDVPIPSITGFTSVFRNIGEVQNIGIETKISTRNLTGPVTWNSFITISAVKNEIKALGPDNAPIYYSPGNAMESINMVGHPIFSYYGLKYNGVYKNQAEIDNDPASYDGAKPGNGKYVDVSGDHVIDSNDRVIIGSYHPDFVWAFSNTFRYKNLDLSFLLQGVLGMDIMDENIHRSWMYHEGRNYHRRLLDRWRSEDEPGDGYIPKLSVNLAKFDLTPSSFFIQDGSYLRLQEVNLGYNIPADMAHKIGASNCRVYFSGTNLLLITKATVYDPENYKSTASDLVRRGANFSEYPSAKTYSLGINIEF
ncbi:TonB-linked outer membrane protein, SusC/RagA family [Bacteroidales bacterium 6E]|nr:TonB-linked outer membrane protein, SusC/RagA family [Bacteroidales bacterium 6E]